MSAMRRGEQQINPCLASAEFVSCPKRVALNLPEDLDPSISGHISPSLIFWFWFELAIFMKFRMAAGAKHG
jgi:hypothetical protein